MPRTVHVEISIEGHEANAIDFVERFNSEARVGDIARAAGVQFQGISTQWPKTDWGKWLSKRWPK